MPSDSQHGRCGPDAAQLALLVQVLAKENAPIPAWKLVLVNSKKTTHVMLALVQVTFYCFICIFVVF